MRASARLGTDRIDLYQIHMQDLRTPEEELLRALDDACAPARSSTSALELRGVSTDGVALGRGQARPRRFVTLQAQYSLASRDLEREHVPLCSEVRARHPAVVAARVGPPHRQISPRASRRRRARGSANGRSATRRFDNERNWKIVDALVAVAGELGKTPSQVALAWLLARPAVSSVIFGARTVAQLDENLGAGDLELPAEAIARSTRRARLELGYPYEFIKSIDGGW